MKKSNIALAALALIASTAAMAEGVTVYGVIDAGIAKSTGTNTYLDGTGGFNGGNWIGFKGSEDLGNGMKADFQLESGLNTNGLVDNGGAAGAGANNAGVLFSRVSTVGLSGDFGSVKLGQQLSPYILAQAVGTAGNGHFFVNRMIMGGGLGNAAVNMGGGNFGMNGFFIPNAVSYTTPSIGGFSATVLTSTKSGGSNGGVTQGDPSDRYDALMIGGAVAGVNVTAGYQKRKDTDRGMTLSASYTMGELTLAGNYTDYKAETTTAVKSYSVSGSYQVMPALSLSLQYARNNLDAAQSIANVGASYSLSKRTSLYATYGTATNGAVSGYSSRGSYAATGDRNNTTAAGVIHSF